MTQPAPPATVGTQPKDAAEVNSQIGTHLRGFVQIKANVNQDQNWLVTVDLKAAPYYFTQDQEDLLKSGIGELDAVLDTVDMTLISRIIGI